MSEAEWNGSHFRITDGKSAFDAPYDYAKARDTGEPIDLSHLHGYWCWSCQTDTDIHIRIDVRGMIALGRGLAGEEIQLPLADLRQALAAFDSLSTPDT